MCVAWVIFQYVHGLVLYCLIVTIYIFSFYLKSLGNASLEQSACLTLMHLLSVGSYRHVWNRHVLWYSDAFIMPLASVSMSSSCWLLFRCYLCSLCSFWYCLGRSWALGSVTRLNWEGFSSQTDFVRSCSAEQCEVRHVSLCLVCIYTPGGKRKNPFFLAECKNSWMRRWSLVVAGCAAASRRGFIYACLCEYVPQQTVTMLSLKTRDCWCQMLRLLIGFHWVVTLSSCLSCLNKSVLIFNKKLYSSVFENPEGCLTKPYFFSFSIWMKNIHHTSLIRTFFFFICLQTYRMVSHTRIFNVCVLICCGRKFV